MPIEIFNPYPIRVPVVAENPATKETYNLSVLPKQKATLLENYVIGTTTAASYPNIVVLNPSTSESLEKTKSKGK
jgi:hypothetical protein